MCKVRKNIFTGTITGPRKKLQNYPKGKETYSKLFAAIHFAMYFYLLLQNNELRLERLSKQSPANARNGPPLVPCQVCGRKFGSRSIKIHEPQCNRRRQMEKESANLNKDQSMIYKQKSSNRETSSATYLATVSPYRRRMSIPECF